MLLNKIIKDIDSSNDMGWYSDDDISSLDSMEDYKDRQSQLRAAGKVAKYLHEHKYDLVIPEHPLFVDDEDDDNVGWTRGKQISFNMKYSPHSRFKDGAFKDHNFTYRYLVFYRSFGPGMLTTDIDCSIDSLYDEVAWEDCFTDNDKIMLCLICSSCSQGLAKVDLYDKEVCSLLNNISRTSIGLVMRRHGTSKYDGSLLKYTRACLKYKKIVIKDSNNYVDKLEDMSIDQVENLSIIDMSKLTDQIFDS